MYLGTSPEFSRSCLCPLLVSTLAGWGFIGTTVAVFTKSLLVWMPIGGLSALVGTAGFLAVQMWRASFKPSVSDRTFNMKVNNTITAQRRTRTSIRESNRRTHCQVIRTLLSASWGICLGTATLLLLVPSSSSLPWLTFSQEQQLACALTYTCRCSTLEKTVISFQIHTPWTKQNRLQDIQDAWWLYRINYPIH